MQQSEMLIAFDTVVRLICLNASFLMLYLTLGSFDVANLLMLFKDSFSMHKPFLSLASCAGLYGMHHAWPKVTLLLYEPPVGGLIWHMFGRIGEKDRLN